MDENEPLGLSIMHKCRETVEAGQRAVKGEGHEEIESLKAKLKQMIEPIELVICVIFFEACVGGCSVYGCIEAYWRKRETGDYKLDLMAVLLAITGTVLIISVKCFESYRQRKGKERTEQERNGNAQNLTEYQLEMSQRDREWNEMKYELLDYISVFDLRKISQLTNQLCERVGIRHVDSSILLSNQYDVLKLAKVCFRRGYQKAKMNHLMEVRRIVAKIESIREPVSLGISMALIETVLAVSACLNYVAQINGNDFSISNILYGSGAVVAGGGCAILLCLKIARVCYHWDSESNIRNSDFTPEQLSQGLEVKWVLYRAEMLSTWRSVPHVLKTPKQLDAILKSTRPFNEAN